jgi:endonuclease YncB( thermonuclease family)
MLKAIVGLLLAGVVSGPVVATVVDVHDGDTFRIVATPWPGVDVRRAVRVRGVDTPEIRGKCDRERERAVEARAFAVAWLAAGAVTLVDIEEGKYAGRVVATVHRSDGADLTVDLIAAGLGRPYDGGARKGWCGG